MLTIEQVAETIWSDILGQEKNNKEAVKEELKTCSSYDDPDAPGWGDFDHIEDRDKRYEAEDNASNIYAEKKMKMFFETRKQKLKKINNEQFEDSAVYLFYFSDNDGSYGSALEHGDVFGNLKHIKINNH